MILTILGGGGFRVPLIYRALLSRPELDTTQLRLFDTDPSRLAAIRQVLSDLAPRSATRPITVTTTTSISDALPGSDFIFSAIRVGGLAGRELDEKIPRAHGLVGQETVGAGGISYALRTIPIVTQIAKQVRDLAPSAWFINFTNPAGIVTEALAPILGERVVGICDSPVGLGRRAIRAVSAPENTQIDYVGLNHLGWVRGLIADGHDFLPDLLQRRDLIESFEEGRLFGADLIQQLKALPNEYLHYYYFTRDVVEADRRAQQTRAEQIRDQQRDFYGVDLGHGTAFDVWDRVRLAREETYLEANRDAAGQFDRAGADLDGGGYEQVAVDIMSAISLGEATTLIVNRPNEDRLAELDPDAVIEAPCRINQDGIHPLPIAPLPEFARGLVHQVKFVEKLVVQAVETRSAATAWQAIAWHPLVDSASLAAKVLASFRAHCPGLEYLC